MSVERTPHDFGCMQEVRVRVVKTAECVLLRREAHEAVVELREGEGEGGEGEGGEAAGEAHQYRGRFRW